MDSSSNSFILRADKGLARLREQTDRLGMGDGGVAVQEVGKPIPGLRWSNRMRIGTRVPANTGVPPSMSGLRLMIVSVMRLVPLLLAATRIDGPYLERVDTAMPPEFGKLEAHGCFMGSQ